MLTHYLKSAIKDLEQIEKYIKDDIKDIKEANHESIFKRTKTKEELIITFENKKALIDNEILKIVQQNQNEELENLISPLDKELLDKLKENLQSLKETNKYFAKLLLAVSEFYNSLYSKMLPTENFGYGNMVAKKEAIFELKG